MTVQFGNTNINSRYIGRRSMGWRHGLGALAGLALAAPLAAQDVQPPTRDELTAPQARPDSRRNVTLTVDGQMERRPCALDNPEYDTLTFTLSGVDYTGAEGAPDVALALAHEDYLGRELPVRALCDIRDRAAALLDAAGYLAAVEIPPQTLGDGRAEMRVVLGRLVAVRARGQTEGVEGLLASHLEQLVGQPVFNVREAERTLLLLSDVPGMDVRLSLRPADGGAPGDLVGEIAVLRQWGAVDLHVQNLGSQALGRFGGLVRAEFYGLTGMGDRTSIAVFSTLDFDEQQTVQLAHEMRLGSDGLVLGGQVTLGWTQPDALPGFTIESETVFANLETSYPFVRRQAFSLWGAAGLDYVDQDVTVNGFDLSRDRLRTAYVRADFTQVDEPSLQRRDGYSPYEPRYGVSGSVELRQGLAIFGASPDCRADLAACVAGGAIPPSRIRQDPTPTFIRAALAAEYRPLPTFTIAGQMRAQYSGHALPGFEEFSGGNYAIGRGFDPAAITGDSGLGASLELRYGSLVPTSPSALAVQPFVFSDMAMVWNEDAATVDDRDQLWSLGGGLRVAHGSSLRGDFTLAVPVHRTDSQTSLGGVRFLFTLTARLLPWSFSR